MTCADKGLRRKKAKRSRHRPFRTIRDFSELRTSPQADVLEQPPIETKQSPFESHATCPSSSALALDYNCSTIFQLLQVDPELSLWTGQVQVGALQLSTIVATTPLHLPLKASEHAWSVMIVHVFMNVCLISDDRTCVYVSIHTFLRILMQSNECPCLCVSWFFRPSLLRWQQELLCRDVVRS